MAPALAWPILGYNTLGRGGAWHPEGTRPLALPKTPPYLALYAALNNGSISNVKRKGAGFDLTLYVLRFTEFVMSRIAATFARLKSEGRTALMPYLMTGFPQRDSALELAPALESAGADLFELGVPVSDPLADGATVQRASERALANGV